MNTNPTKYDKSDMICVAAIAGAHGVKGDVKLKAFTETPLDCLTYGALMDIEGRVILSPGPGRRAGKFIAVNAPEVTNREQAEAMKSTKLYVPISALPEADEDEFYYHDLVGLSVRADVDEGAGEIMGKVIAVHEFGAGDMLEIKPLSGPSYYHPFTKAAVPFVDIKAAEIRIIVQISDKEDEAQKP